jgi:hypothetical protein
VKETFTNCQNLETVSVSRKTRVSSQAFPYSNKAKVSYYD